MAVVKIAIPPNFITAMNGFMGAVDISIGMVKQIQNIQAKTARPVKVPTGSTQSQFYSLLTGHLNQFPALLNKLSSSILRSIERMIRWLGSKARTFISSLVIPSHIFSGLDKIIKLAGSLSAARFAMLFRFGGIPGAIVAVMKWIYDKSIQLMETVQKDRIQSMVLGTTIGGLRAFRTAFWMLPEDPFLMSAISQLRNNAISAQALQIFGTLGVSRNIDSVEQMIQVLRNAQPLLRKFPGQEFQAARELGFPLSPATLAALMDPRITPAELKRVAERELALRGPLGLTPDETDALLNFLNEKQILFATVKAVFLKTLVSSGFADTLIKMTENLTKWLRSFSDPGSPSITPNSSTKNKSSSLIGEVEKQIADLNKYIDDKTQSLKKQLADLTSGAGDFSLIGSAAAAEGGRGPGGIAGRIRGRAAVTDRYGGSYALPGGPREDPRGLVQFIRDRAIANGMDPDIALRVARSEGLGNFYGDRVGGRPTSFGTYQLHIGGLADEFRRDTGLDPSDPKNERATIDWSLRYAHDHGWGTKWMGAQRIGVNRGAVPGSRLPPKPDYSAPQYHQPSGPSTTNRSTTIPSATGTSAEPLVPSSGGSTYLRNERAWIGDELNADPGLRRYLRGVIAHEQSGEGQTRVMESLANRLNYLRANGEPNLTLRQYFSRTGTNQFYGPIRHGKITEQYLTQYIDPYATEEDERINRVLGGSNLIRGMTDQGSEGDPNFGRGETIMHQGEGYNDFGNARAWRINQQQHVAEGGTTTAGSERPDTERGLFDPRPESERRLIPKSSSHPINQQPSATAPAAGGDRLRQPVSASGFGSRVGEPRPGHIHQGDDVNAPYGSPLYATQSGTIVSHNPNGAFQPNRPGEPTAGAVTILKSDTGEFYTVYMHHNINQSLIGKHVDAGQQIGVSGRANGVDHVHIEFWHGHPWRSGSIRYNPSTVFGWRRGHLPVGGQYVHPPPSGQETPNPVDKPEDNSDSVLDPRPEIERKHKLGPEAEPKKDDPPQHPAENGDSLTHPAHKDVKVENKSDAVVQIKYNGSAGSNLGDTQSASPMRRRGAPVHDDWTKQKLAALSFPTKSDEHEEEPNSIPVNALAFTRAIGRTESEFSRREAYSDANNQLTGKGHNANMIRLKKAGQDPSRGADYGYYQQNQEQVDEVVRKYGISRDTAQHLTGGLHHDSTLEQQTRATAEYLKARWPNQYKNLIEKNDYQGMVEATRGTWYGLADPPRGKPKDNAAEYKRVIDAARINAAAVMGGRPTSPNEMWPSVPPASP